MSHFTVLVISTSGDNDVDYQLEPFDESLEVPTDGEEVSEFDIQSFVDYYVKKNPSLSELSPKEIYAIHGNEWNGREWEFDEDGNALSFSTYNPDSKWDWYQIGGRWAGSLKLKDSVADEYEINPGFSWGWKEEDKLATISQKRVDQARVCDVDWEGMRDAEKFENACRFWEIYVDGEEPKTEKDKDLVKWAFYKPEYFLETYKDKVTYARCVTNFSTYAVLKDGEWISPGDMGWFGISSESQEDKLKWELDFYDIFIKDLPEQSLITVVDCHI